jgi:hypothetical protein
MKRSVSSLFVVTGILFSLATAARAIQIREYLATRHNRFTGFPGNPVWNSGAWFDSSKFSGIGWGQSQWLSRTAG